jgi:hypothetical protein
VPATSEDDAPNCCHFQAATTDWNVTHRSTVASVTPVFSASLCGITRTFPSGRTYTTKPGGSVFFPILATPTGGAAIRKLTTEPGQGRGVMMPRRTRTRAEELQDRITAERRINEQRLKRERWVFEEIEKRRQALADDERPPF